MEKQGAILKSAGAVVSGIMLIASILAIVGTLQGDSLYREKVCRILAKGQAIK